MNARRVLLAAACGVAVAATVAAVAVLTEPPAPGPAVIAVAPGVAPRVQQWQADTAFLAAVRARGVQGTEGELLTTAGGVCRILGGGGGRDEAIVSVEERLAVEATTAEFVVDEAILARCPDAQEARNGP